MEDNKKICVHEFYRGRNIFITGATGFIGKVLLEKFLRCLDVKKIFVLVRSKKGKDIEARKQELFQSEIFSRIKEKCGDVLDKVTFLSGDIRKRNLGMNASDISSINENVSVVIHCAASVSFNLSLRECIAVNVTSTKEIAEMARNIHNLVAFVYVSTAFCNFDKYEVEEIVYPLQVSVQDVLKAVEWLDDEGIEKLGKKLLNGRPNFYTLTKSMAENILNECYTDLPLVIVRPSIVMAAWKEPIPGWIEGYGGTTGALVGFSKAIISSLVIEVEKRAELIPVDSFVNVLIVATWDKAIGESKEPKVYHVTCTGFNNASWGDMWCNYLRMIWKYPPTEVFLTYRIKATTSTALHHTMVVIMDYIPAMIADLLLKIKGRKMSILRSCINMKKLLSLLRPFTSNQWNFHTENMHKLLQKLPPEDKLVFNFDISDLHWRTFMEKYVYGIRRFIFKEDPKTIPRAKKSLMRKHYALMAFLLGVCSFILYESIEFIFQTIFDST